jgi:hypothetical protein
MLYITYTGTALHVTNDTALPWFFPTPYGEVMIRCGGTVTILVLSLTPLVLGMDFGSMS